MVALIAAGCSNAPAPAGTGSGPSASVTTTAQTSSNSPAASGGGSNTAANRAQAVKFSQCMRDNGVKDFPDPDASGALTIDGVLNGSSLDPDSAAWKKATTACKDLEPAGFTGHKRSAQEQEAALKFAQCIRDNGVKDFPDPAPDAPLLNVDGSNREYMAALNAAMRKCRDFSTKAGVTGG